MRRFIIGLVLIVAGGAIGFAVLLMNNERLQDRVIQRALEAQIARVGAQSFGGDQLEVVFCGTASPMGGGRAQQCMAIFAGDQFFVVDSGARSAGVQARLGLPVGRLNGVLLTHFHSDHIAALGELHLASWVQGRPYKLPIYGGAGVGDVVAGFNQAYGQDYSYRTRHHGTKLMPPENAGLVAQQIDAPARGAKTIHDKDGLRISVFRVTHEPIEPAFGYRFDYKGRSIVVSGDTSKDDNLARVAKGADVLIHEVLQPHLVAMFAQALRAAGNHNVAQLLKDTLTYHTTPAEAVAITKQARARRLVFTHFAPVPQNRLIERAFLRGLDDDDAEDIILADDGTHIALPVGTDDIVVR